MACTNTESFVQHGMRHVVSKVNSGTINLAGELLPDVASRCLCLQGVRHGSPLRLLRSQTTGKSILHWCSTGLPGGWSQAPIEALECQSLESASKLIDSFAFSWQVFLTFKRQSPVVPNQLTCLQGKSAVRIRDT